MLDSVTKKRIDDLRNILVGKIPSPQSQVEQITTGLIYKFMHDMDNQAIEMGGVPSFFIDEYEKYSWKHLFNKKLGGVEKVKLYSDAIENLYNNPNAPSIFREIFKNSFLPFKDPSTLNMFLKEINEFHYSNSEQLGDAYEYLLSFMGSQGDAGQFRTPRHIIDFIIQIVNPQKSETILDPACGTSGFLISSYKHILAQNTQARIGDKLNASERKKIGNNLIGYDIDPSMSRISLVNMYLHNFASPNISEYDTLSSEDKWNDYFDVILANPPFFSPTGGIKPHSRFGIKSTRAEVLFVDYISQHLKPNGRAGIIVPEGIIFQTGTAYKTLRKKLIEDSLVGVISLPSGVFQPYSGVKTSILILDKAISRKSKDIFFAKVENDGFTLGAQRNPDPKNDLPKVLSQVSLFLKNTKCDLQQVNKSEILSNQNFSLNASTYKTSSINNLNHSMISIGNKDYFEIVAGGTPKSQEDSYWNGKVNWISLVDLPASNLITQIHSSERTITELGLEKSSAKIIPVNSVIVSTRATIGRVAINRIPLSTNQGFKNIVIKDHSKINCEFLAYMMTKLKNQMLDLATGGTFKEISKTNFESLKIPIPLIEIQQKIVNEIVVYQKIIDGCRQIIDNYKPTIEIDPSWEMVELGALFNFQNGYAFKSEDFVNDGIQLVRMGNIKKGFFDIDNKAVFLPKEFESKYEKFILSDNDLIISMTGTTGKEDYGNVCKISGGKFLLNQRVGRFLKKSNNINEQFFYYLTQTEFFRSKLFAKSSGGVRQANISGDAIKAIEIPLPDFLTQSKIADSLDKELEMVKGNTTLMHNFQNKITEKINRIFDN